MEVELLVQNGKKLYCPCVQDGMTWTTEWKGSAGVLTFDCVQDDSLCITEGNAVSFKVNGKNVFYGFIFKIGSDNGKSINVTAYDQLRYFKNKDTKVFKNKTASQILKSLVANFGLKGGVIKDTAYRIPSRVEDNQTLFDMTQNAIGITVQNTGKLFLFYDDFGKITLKSLGDMKTDVLIDEETGSTYNYTTSIDDNTYNQIKLTYDNEKTGKREVYIAKDSSHINQWGMLQYYDTLQEGENGKAKVDALLKLYNAKTRTLSINDCAGSLKVRAGSLVWVKLVLRDVELCNPMLVSNCKHTFSNNQHLMSLTLEGGGFVA